MPATMKAWLYSAAAGGLEKNLTFTNDATAPSDTLSPDQIYVEVISMALNPADYKLPELPVVGRFVASKPASPGFDYCGRVVSVGSALATVYQPGQVVFGKLDGPTKFGTLAQYTIAPRSGAAALPDGVDPDHGAGTASAALTAYQSIVPYVKQGDRIFINGGSGGVGSYGIQIAKALGCHVTTSCSSANVQLCKDLGADEVVDYRTTNVVQQLKTKQAFSHIVDNVGVPMDLYNAADHFLHGGTFIQVGAEMSLTGMLKMMSHAMWPTVLGGGKNAYKFLQCVNSEKDLAQITQWMQQGKLKALIDSTFELEDAPQAYQKLRTGRARGKIIVHVTEK